MIHHGTDWNRHHGVGATLLENWVEERAVGDLILQERSDISKLSRYGHKDILTHPSGQNSSDHQSNAIQSTHRDSFQLPVSVSRSQHALRIGKRRQLMDAELFKIAMNESKTQTDTVHTPKQWKSTTQDDYSHTDIYKQPENLGSKLPDPVKSTLYAKPITFWTDYASKGSGTAICSIPSTTLHTLGHHSANYTAEKHGDHGNECDGKVVGHRSGQVHQHDASTMSIRFGKHSSFSTPIQEYNKGSTKE